MDKFGEFVVGYWGLGVKKIKRWEFLRTMNCEVK